MILAKVIIQAQAATGSNLFFCVLLNLQHSLCCTKLSTIKEAKEKVTLYASECTAYVHIHLLIKRDAEVEEAD